VSPFDPRAVFINHGGRITATNGANSVFDTIIARRLSTDDVLSGKVELPMDQVRFTRGHCVQPYALTFVNGNIHLDVGLSDPNTADPAINPDTAGGEEIAISWRYHEDYDGFLHVKSPFKSGPSDYGRVNIKDQVRGAEALPVQYRSTIPDITSPVAMPSAGLLFVTTGDRIRQLRVSGATCADPIHLLISGDGDGHGWIREFATQPTDLRCELVFPTYGDGDYAALFLNNGGRIGLGTRDWNIHSAEAWSRLGLDHVTIFADGDGTVDVNSDLLVADKYPLIPTTNFGDGKEAHRIEFYSEDHRVIRIPAGSELDLSAFGSNGNNQEQISFAGKIKLVFEPGAILRLPDGRVVGEEPEDTGPIIYMNDEAKMIFEGTKDRSRDRYTSVAGAIPLRSKILGKGQIWLNKDAEIHVNGGALLGIESDSKTLYTDITISIQRQGAMYIGTENLAGGAFQVGNTAPVFEGSQPGKVSFTLRLEGPKALFHIDREGFVGFGAGTVNFGGTMNGTAPLANNPVRNPDGSPVISGGNPVFLPDEDNAWQLLPLYDVENIEIKIIRGIFDHSNIFSGERKQASLMAIGPSEGYTMSIGSEDNAHVLGGGNVMFLRSNQTTPLSVNVWSFADPLTGITNDENDNGKYTLLSSTDILRQRVIGTAAAQAANSSILVPTDVATTINITTVIDLIPVVNGRIFTANNQDDFYNFLAYPDYPEILPAKYVDLGSTQYNEIVGYVNNGVRTTQSAPTTGGNYANAFNITRIEDPVAYEVDGEIANAKDGVETGVLGGTGSSVDNGPERFVVLQR
jgi:hypothetical protein